jgi:hypothetical protein
MSIENFYAAAQNMEFARDFQFRIRSLGPFTENDLLYLKTATLPNKAITNKQVPYMGLQFNIPGSVTYPGSDSWSVKFWADEPMNIRNKLESYIKEIFNDETSTGKYGVPTELATMDLLGKNMETLRRYQFIGIYPKEIGTIEYDIGGSGEPKEFTAIFAYQYWRLIGA